MRLVRLSLLAACIAGAPIAAAVVTFSPTEAQASVSIAVTYDALVKDADAVGVATPVEKKTVWEDGRIYTYTRVKIDQNVAGELPSGSDGWVRTMGGVVGKVGQLVDGEPVFTPGKPSLVFMRKLKAGAPREGGALATGGTWEVSARAQGQYPVVSDETGKIRKVVRSTSVGMLYPPKVKAAVDQLGPVAPTGGVTTRSVDPSTPLPAGAATAEVVKLRLANEALHDPALDEVAKEIATSWKRLHPAAAPSDAKK
jgi:hypothetical protein